MILVTRRPEPDTLTRARARRLPDAITARRNHEDPELSGYDASGVKLALFEGQRKKCAWCERRRDFSSSPIEHYRPKDGAWRNLPDERRRVSTGHYWWLTWTWTNLLFSCARCNDAGHKANYFPLEAGTLEAAPSLDPPVEDVSAERPLLLDPAVDTFLDHVRWVPTDPKLARSLWTWSPKGLTPRGMATIAILNLYELADEIQGHLEHVLDLVEEVERHFRDGRDKDGAGTWERVLAYLAPTKNFTAATWCALNSWMPQATLDAWKLPSMPRPR